MGSGHKQEAGQQDRPKRINVFERIKTNATEPPSRVVTKKMRRETVRCFVKRDGCNDRDDPDRRQINDISGHRLIPFRPVEVAVTGKLGP